MQLIRQQFSSTNQFIISGVFSFCQISLVVTLIFCLFDITISQDWANSLAPARTSILKYFNSSQAQLRCSHALSRSNVILHIYRFKAEHNNKLKLLQVVLKLRDHLVVYFCARDIFFNSSVKFLPPICKLSLKKTKSSLCHKIL